MSKHHMLRALVNERLTAVAEEIFTLFEWSIAEYEEQLRLSKKENQRKQQLLDSVLNPRILLSRTGVWGLNTLQSSHPRPDDDISETAMNKDEEKSLLWSVPKFEKTEECPLIQQIEAASSGESQDEDIISAGVGVLIPSPSCEGPGLNQRITQGAEIKEEPEEQRVKHEEEQLPVSVLEPSTICVKSEEFSLLQQKRTKHHEETQERDISPEPHFPSEPKGDTDNSSNSDDGHWERPLSYLVAQIEPPFDADGVKADEVQIRDGNPTPRNQLAPKSMSTISDGVMSVSDEGIMEKKHLCFMCGKRFGSKQILQRHIRVHTGERPYSCSICNKTFHQKGNLENHKKIHTAEKLNNCSICGKTFARKSHLQVHMRTHTGDKPYSCSFCSKEFTVSANLKVHLRAHTGEKPYSCSTCEKTFFRKAHLDVHMRVHTGDKPYSCSICKKSFSQKSNLTSHERKHTSEKPYSCSHCSKEFSIS